jgi:hypothetical protein
VREPGAVRDPSSSRSGVSPRRKRAAATGPPSLASRFLAGRPVQCDDPEALAATVFELEDRLDTSVDTAHFSESVRTERAVETARAQLLESLKVTPEVSPRASETRRELDDFGRTMSYREQQLEIRLRTQVQQLREKHAHELALQEQRFLVEPKQRRFNRSSQKLRIFRLQRQLVLGRVDEAPTPADPARVAPDFQTARAQLEQKHADELETLIQACDLRRNEFRYIRETLAKRFAPNSGIAKTEEQPLADPDGFWAKARRGEIDATGARRKVQVSKTPAGSEVTAVPLPPLEKKDS